MTNANPLQAQLDQVAATAEAEAASQPINQDGAAQNVQQAQPMTHAPAVSMANAPVAHQPAAALSMDSTEVQVSGSVASFLKLRDGGLLLEDAKFAPTKFKLRVEDASAGGSFRPCKSMNYQSPAGYIYTKSYDGVTAVSSTPAHNNISWAENVQKILNVAPNAYEFLAFELVLELAETTKSVDGKTEILAGTRFGYTTPYTAAKLVKALWDKALAEGKRGQDIYVVLEGVEVSKDGNEFKKLVINSVDA